MRKVLIFALFLLTLSTGYKVVAQGGQEKEIGKLIEQLKDKDWYVRDTAAIALGKTGDKKR